MVDEGDINVGDKPRHERLKGMSAGSMQRGSASSASAQNTSAPPPTWEGGRVLKGGALAGTTPAFQRRMTLVQTRKAHGSDPGHAGQEGNAQDGPMVYPTRLAPLTREDIDLAFETLSRDGKRIRREDIKYFADLLFGSTVGVMPSNAPNSTSLSNPHSQPGLTAVNTDRAQQTIGAGLSGGGKEFTANHSNKTKALKAVSFGKEEVTRDGLMNLLLNKHLESLPFPDAFQWFDPHVEPGQVFLNEQDLRRISAAMSPYGIPHRGDVASLLARFDVDKDGVIGLGDFKRMAI
ncbi:hypothetical protein DFS34DRAFT_265660 [Phlyctochytrium arcticum]|nr:hypothetical protein DFS34DRAFT_265660 [Phlyctochytrium arcticum]